MITIDPAPAGSYRVNLSTSEFSPETHKSAKSIANSEPSEIIIDGVVYKSYIFPNKWEMLELFGKTL
jgi:hypothetical protein